MSNPKQAQDINGKTYIGDECITPDTLSDSYDLDTIPLE